MDVELKQKWVDALRSGEYAQCQGTLGIIDDGEESYCCLGVLNEITGNERELRHPSANPDYTEMHYLDDRLDFEEVFYSGVNRNYLHSLGLRQDDMDRLAKMNDNGRSFDEIADWVEANL